MGVLVLYSLPGIESVIWPGVQIGGDSSSFAEIVISPEPADILIRDFRTDKGLGATYAPNAYCHPIA